MGLVDAQLATTGNKITSRESPVDQIRGSGITQIGDRREDLGVSGPAR